MAAKQLVAALRSMELPPLVLSVRRIDTEFETFEATKHYRDVKQWLFESARAEVELESIRSGCRPRHGRIRFRCPLEEK